MLLKMLLEDKIELLQDKHDELWELRRTFVKVPWFNTKHKKIMDELEFYILMQWELWG